MSGQKRALAIGAHPDDVEFMMAGTLILLKNAGYEPHIMTAANGSCGTAEYDRETIIKLRREEAKSAARSIGAEYHEAPVDDLEIYYEHRTVLKIVDTIRKVQPEILLLPSPVDYMEDHQITCRLGVTAAFSRSLNNLPATVKAASWDIFLYHALPWGLRDWLRKKIWAEMYVDISAVIDRKQEMLACHKTQQAWLDTSQNLNQYLKTMREVSEEVAKMSGQKWQYAEGWRRHTHLGYSAEDRDKLAEVLGDKVRVDQKYLKWLETPPWESG